MPGIQCSPCLEKYIYISKDYIVESIVKCMVMYLLLNIKHKSIMFVYSEVPQTLQVFCIEHNLICNMTITSMELTNIHALALSLWHSDVISHEGHCWNFS